MRLNARLALAFATAPSCTRINLATHSNSRTHYAKGKPPPLAGLRHLVAIGHQLVFSLRRWASRIQARFHVSRSTWGIPRALIDFAYGPVTLYGRTFQNFSAIESSPTLGPRNPAMQARQFRLFPFRSPLLRESLPLSFPQGTEMFHFPWFHSDGLCIQPAVTRHDSGRVSPFGYLRIIAYLPLPEAFRSLSRPSSSSDAKASTMRS
jgi:hypothetical protein